MKSPSFSRWWLVTATFTAAALAAASMAYWVLKWQAAATETSAPAAPLVNVPQADARAVARLLGGGQVTTLAETSPVPAPSASQFKLLGVVAERGKGGYALIAIDDQPAKPYRVGSAVGETLFLHSVAARSAALSTDMQLPASVQLTLPDLTPAQTSPPSR